MPKKPENQQAELELTYPETDKQAAKRDKQRHVNRVGQYCQRLFSRTEVLSTKQENTIRLRLKTFTADQLIQVLNFIKAEPWYTANGQTEITSIFGSDERVRQTLERATKQQPTRLDVDMGPSKRTPRTKRI